MSKCTRTSLLALGVLLLAFFNTAFAGEMVPLKGRYENNQGKLTGNITHLGAFTQVSPPWTWEAANGDTVSVVYSNFRVTKDIAPGVFEYAMDFTITGGTGRFENATGFGTGYGTADLAENYRWGTIDGMVSRPNSGKK